jgi:hypothetical protein
MAGEIGAGNQWNTGAPATVRNALLFAVVHGPDLPYPGYN